MAEYYVVRNKSTGEYFRGKGANRWGKYYNQAAIYRIKGQAECSVKHLSYHSEHAEIVPIRIVENSVDAVKVVHGWWEDVSLRFTQVKEKCSVCGGIVYEVHFKFCPHCGAKMDGERRSDV